MGAPRADARAAIDKIRRQRSRPLFSVDTYHVDTARRALALGADIINDVSGLTSAAMIELAGASGKDWIAMQTSACPPIRRRLSRSIETPAKRSSVGSVRNCACGNTPDSTLERIIFDPGIGFGKNPLQSLRLLRDLKRFQRYGLRCLVGHSRKSFMHKFAAAGNADRDLFTIGVSLDLCARGVDILRVHNVPAHLVPIAAGRT